MRGWRVGLGWLVVLAACGPTAAQACLGCSSELTCTWVPRGGLVCLADGIACLMAGKCMGPMQMGESIAIRVTLLDPGTSAGLAPARAVPIGAETAVGRSAARIVMRTPGGPAVEPQVMYSGTGLMEEGTAAFRAPTGDGFTLGIERAGENASVTVCALAAGRPGRVLALTPVATDEALVVQVPFEGRTRFLVLTVQARPDAEGRARAEAARRELADEATVPSRAARPPFELQVLER